MTVKPKDLTFAVATCAAIVSGCHFLPTDADLGGTYAGRGGDLLQLAAPAGGADLLADISTRGGDGSSCKVSGSAHLANTRLRFTADDQPACNFVIGIGGGGDPTTATRARRLRAFL
jgi:hypothetical protein